MLEHHQVDIANHTSQKLWNQITLTHRKSQRNLIK